MKKILLITITLLFTYAISFAQDYTRDGNTFSAVSKTKAKSEPVKTTYAWKDKNGQVYPIYKSSKGSFFIVKVSKKTGKEYRYYLPKSIKDEIR